MCGCKDCQGITLFKGKDGRGIVSITAQEDGTFIYLYTDGTTYISPDLTGPQGDQGVPGTPAVENTYYKARIIQEVTDPVTASNIIQDDILGVWTRNIPGKYIYTKVGAFLANKTFILLTNNVRGGSYVLAERLDDNRIELSSTNALGVSADSIIDNVYISIEINNQ